MAMVTNSPSTATCSTTGIAWLVEQPNGDFGRTMARQLLCSRPSSTSLPRTAESPGRRSCPGWRPRRSRKWPTTANWPRDWMIRLGDGTDESARADGRGARLVLALHPRIVRGRREARGIDRRRNGPRSADASRANIAARWRAVLAEAKLEVPADQRPILGGRRGHHSEHLGHLLAVMQHIAAHLPRRELVTDGRTFSRACGSPRSCPRPTRRCRSASMCRTSWRTRFAFKAGQHLTLKADIDGEEVRRNYSLCVAPDEGLVKVTVKRIAGGVFSNWVGDDAEAPATRSTS